MTDNNYDDRNPRLLFVGGKTCVNSLAGSIAHALRDEGVVAIQAIGASAVNQMVKGLAVARNYLMDEGRDLKAVPEMVEVEIQGGKRTAVRILAML